MAKTANISNREAARGCEPSQNWHMRTKSPARGRADRQYEFQMQCRKLTGRPIGSRSTCAHGSYRRTTEGSSSAGRPRALELNVALLGDRGLLYRYHLPFHLRELG